MLKRILPPIAALAVSTGSASAVTVDFEGISGFFDETSASSIFSGIIFDRDVQVLPGTSVAPGPGQSGQVARAATPPFGANPRGGDIGGSFDGFTVSSLSVVVGDSGSDKDMFQLFGLDANNTVITSSGVVSSNAATTVSIMGTGIASFFLAIDDLPDTGGSSVIDNINFAVEMSAVPVPASLPMLGLGVLAFGVAARRRKA